MSFSNRPKGTPGKTLIGFTILAAVVAAFTVREHFARDHLEETHFPTALGDTDYWDLMETTNRADIALQVDGVPFYRLEYAPGEEKDEAMYKVARDDSDRYFLYRRQSSEGAEGAEGTVAEDEKDAPRFYVKTGLADFGKGLYLKVGPELPEAWREILESREREPAGEGAE